MDSSAIFALVSCNCTQLRLVQLQLTRAIHSQIALLSMLLHILTISKEIWYMQHHISKTQEPVHRNASQIMDILTADNLLAEGKHQEVPEQLNTSLNQFPQPIPIVRNNMTQLCKCCDKNHGGKVKQK